MMMKMSHRARSTPSKEKSKMQRIRIVMKMMMMMMVTIVMRVTVGVYRIGGMVMMMTISLTLRAMKEAVMTTRRSMMEFESARATETYRQRSTMMMWIRLTAISTKSEKPSRRKPWRKVDRSARETDPTMRLVTLSLFQSRSIPKDHRAESTI